MILKKQDINCLPLKELDGYTPVELENWCKQEKIYHHHQWLLPQLVARFGAWTLVKNELGQIDPKLTRQHNLSQNPLDRVLWRLAMITRSSLLPSQTQHPEYAQFTPLVLMGFKRMQGIPYSHWQGLQNLEYVLEPKLFEALNLSREQLQILGDLGSGDLLRLREHGLMNKTGAKIGTLKPAESTWALTRMDSTELAGFPKLTQTMVTQIWVAHPSKRTPYMILDPLNWDRMPDPLVTTEVFHKPADPKPKKQPNAFELPWL